MQKLKSEVLVFFLTLSFPFIAACQEKPEQPADTTKNLSRNDVQIENLDGVEVRTIYYNDKSKTQTQYKNGVRNGWTRNIDEKGNITSEGFYLNNKMEGEFKSYSADGKILLKANYKNGLLDGSSFYYFPDGKVQKEIKYEKNKILFIKEYDNNGSLIYEDKY